MESINIANAPITIVPNKMELIFILINIYFTINLLLYNLFALDAVIK